MYNIHCSDSRSEWVSRYTHSEMEEIFTESERKDLSLGKEITSVRGFKAVDLVAFYKSKSCK